MNRTFILSRKGTHNYTEKGVRYTEGPMKANSRSEKGTFIYRPGRSGEIRLYYTPEVLTQCLVNTPSKSFKENSRSNPGSKSANRP